MCAVKLKAMIGKRLLPFLNTIFLVANSFSVKDAKNFRATLSMSNANAEHEFMEQEKVPFTLI